MYVVPNDYYYRLHHVRPRFKRNVENVLIFVAEEISRIGRLPELDFRNMLNYNIRSFPGNHEKTEKTINNWRTEISALFGFVINKNGLCEPGLRAVELAEKQDLVEFFKKFLYCFQYPGSHIKDHEVVNDLKNGIKFKPAQYLIKLLRYAEKSTNSRCYITKGEFCHCIFNDLRCIRDNEKPKITWGRILENREKHVDYDLTGDVVRYAGDLMDYMVYANLLITHNNIEFYLNNLENDALIIFDNSNEWFGGYDNIDPNLEDVASVKDDWFSYVNRPLDNIDFSTNLLALVAESDEEYEQLVELSKEAFTEKLSAPSKLSPKDIGDYGESLILTHEKQRIKNEGREDLTHLITLIPNQSAVGYDINSIESNEQRRLIEVKTTISHTPLKFYKFYLTTNEWRAAVTYGDRYFIYRLMVNKDTSQLFVIQNPVQLFLQGQLNMMPDKGANLTILPESSGNFEELLTWKD